jgi:D-beta-D-heptose 7-phosphate kinase/D-beta-D-heptose 1-phosphate adenosyltransferase
MGLRAKGKKVVFTNGCFDLFHTGHLKLLREARKLGDALVVAINSDRSVRKLKGPGRPYITEADRALLLAALDCVDYLCAFEEDTPLELIKELKPDVLVKGGDYRREEVVGGGFVESLGGRIVIIPLVKGMSTSTLAEKIKNGNK